MGFGEFPISKFNGFSVCFTIAFLFDNAANGDSHEFHDFNQGI